MSLDVGTQLGPFEISGLIGVGGMGEVYRARDSKLGREVAIKVLPEAFANDKDRLARFEREAKTLASLDHPGIGHIHDLQEAEGIRFLVMQLIEGPTLDDLFAAGPIEIERALPIFQQIAEALQYAHERGVVHRDLKPANIKVTDDGSVKILDFGLAKVLDADTEVGESLTQTHAIGSDPAGLTGEGKILGTPAYMSPEQARGEKVDKRTDVWAFSCCLYEALSGRRPFRGKTPSDLIAEILKSEPDWSALSADTPPGVAQILRRGLKKEARRRMRDLGDVALTIEDTITASASDLDFAVHAPKKSTSVARLLPWVIAGVAVVGLTIVLATGGGPGGSTNVASDAPIRSLAVLPFENLMGDETKEYFVDGMTDTLTAELSKIRSIKVIARTSAMKFKNSDESLSEIARQLGVDGLIEGSVQQFENEIRITAQLVHGASEEQLWADNFEGTLAGIMKLQGEVAISIAEEIGAVLTPQQRDEYASAKDVNPQAYDLYLQGRSIMQSRTENDLRIAINLFEEAVSRDPQFALPHSGMADVYSLMPIYGFGTSSEVKDKAFEHANKAIELDDSLADAHASLGWAYTQFDIDRNWAAAERAYQRAIELNPGLARARRWYSTLLTSLGRDSDAVREARLAFELDPLDPLVLMNLAFALQHPGGYDEAEDLLLRASKMDPSLSMLPFQLRILYERFGRLEEALESARKVYAITRLPRDQWEVIFLSTALEGPEALQALVAEVERGEHDASTLYNRAYLYFAVGDTDQAFENLEKSIPTGGFWNAMNTRSRLVIQSFESDPQDRRYLDDDPRFWKMLGKFNLPPLPPEHPRYENEQAYLRQKAAEEALAAQPKTVRRFDIPIDDSTQFDKGFKSFELSPDGRKLVYVSTDQVGDPVLFLHRFEHGSTVALPGTKFARQPFFSPDGEWVAFFNLTRLLKVSIHAGTTMELAEAQDPRGGDWGPDGSIVFGHGFDGLRLVPATGGEPTVLTRNTDEYGFHRWPQFLPDRKTVLFTASSTKRTRTGTSALLTVSLETGEMKEILQGGYHGRYMASGHLVYAIPGNLMAVPFDLERLETVGSPAPVLGDLQTHDSMRFAYYAASSDGLLAYLPDGGGGGNTNLVWVDHTGEKETLDTPAGGYRFPTVSPDGTRVAVEKRGHIYVLDLSGDLLSRFTFEGSRNFGMVWSRDGKELFFGSDRDAGSGNAMIIYRKLSDGSGQAEQIPIVTGTSLLTSISADGETLYGYGVFTGTGLDMWEISLSGEGELKSLLQTRFNEGRMKLSPDGNWMVYTSDESGQMEVYVRRYPDMTGKWQVSVGGGGYPLWAQDMSQLYYRSADAVMAMDLDLSESFRAGQPKRLFEDRYVRHGGYSYDLSPDGKRFLMIEAVDGTSEPLKAVTNWFEELQRLVPTGEDSKN